MIKIVRDTTADKVVAEGCELTLEGVSAAETCVDLAFRGVARLKHLPQQRGGMTSVITPVILCGGSGSRLWPRSRAESPKPFLPLIGDETLFEQALKRCQGEEFQRPVIVTGAAQLPLVQALSGIANPGEIIVEPQPRQTAAAVALAALRLPPESILLVCPSDHHIRNAAAFRRTADEATAIAADGWLVCFGIRPTAAETRFGYVQKGEPVGEMGCRVKQFVEKPGAAAAAAFVEAGEYFWNGGIFAFRARDYLAELARYRPAMVEHAREAVAAGHHNGGVFHPDASRFSAIEPESIDFAVMEHSDRVAMVIADMDWSDVGDWRALYQMRQKDEAGNAVIGPASLVDCRRVLIETDGPKVHLIGLEDLVVVVDGDDVFIATTGDAWRVAELLDRER
jgi:mannose-1-phosphate guanylyltransferase